MGFRSYESTQKAVKRMVRKGELIPKGNNVYVNRHGVEVTFIKMEKGSHGGVMSVPKNETAIDNKALIDLIKKLKDAGSELPIREGVY